METEKRKKLGAANKRKGSNCERKYRLIFRSLGFLKCETSRYANKLYDACKIDLVNLPFNVQIKAGKQKGLNPISVLSDVSQRITDIFPKQAPEHKYPTILVHRREVGRGKKRNKFDDMVYMSFEDFEKIINMIKWD